MLLYPLVLRTVATVWWWNEV